MSELYIDQSGRIVTTVPERGPRYCDGCVYTPAVKGGYCSKEVPVEHLNSDGCAGFCSTRNVIYVEVKDE